VIYEANTYDGVYTGIRWQCVEFARRWLLQQKGMVYGDVDTAADIWTKIDYLTEVASGNKIPLVSRVNGSTQAPNVGDLLIYAGAFYGTGHVAVITAIDNSKGLIEVGEQNYSNTSWHDDHARTIPFIKKANQYWLLDSYLLGWKQIQQ
jgi:glutathionylspermidine amidase/synthetase